MKLTKLRLPLLASFLALAVIGCKDLKIPNGPTCVGVVKGGFCKASVTGEEERISHQRMIDLIWKEGAVVVPAPLYAEYVKVMEKICNRQKKCEMNDIGRTLEVMKKLAQMSEKSEEVIDTKTNSSAEAGLKTKEK